MRDYATFSVSREAREVVLVATGEIDLTNATSLRAALESLAAGLDGQRPIVDLAGVTFIDSAGLHALERGHNVLDCKLALRNPTPPVRRVIELILPGYFEIDP